MPGKVSESFHQQNTWETGCLPWNGTKIGEIVVPANAAKEQTQFKIDVSRFVDHLDKKHAIFLVAEGEESSDLFDLIGFGFSSKKKQIAPPVVPSVSITVSGKVVDLPEHPVRSTNANGIVGYNLYETTFSLPSGTAAAPVVSASSDQKNVKVHVTQADSPAGTAKVEFDFKGVIKTYNIKFEIRE